MQREFLGNQPPLRIIIPHNFESRMKETCFRGGGFAGTFREWRCVQALFGDEVMRTALISKLSELATQLREKENKRSNHTISVEHPERWIGWVSAAPLVDLTNTTELQDFKPNDLTTAKRVANPSVRAPRTTYATFNCEIRLKEEFVQVTIYKIYPGPALHLANTQPTTIPPEVAVFFGQRNLGK